jgi:lysophospholipase L1-like esterase
VRIRLLIFLLFLFPLENKAQDESYYNTTYYQQKLTQFRLIPDKESGEIVFLGDSITDIAEWSDLLKNPHVKNRGISGDNTYGVLHRLDEIISRKPSGIFIMIGINDIAVNIPDSIIVKNYTRIVETLKKNCPTAKIVIQSILPTNNNFTEFANHQNKDVHIRQVNTALEQLAKKHQIRYVDLYAGMTDREGKLNKAYTNDGLHLTGEGYASWIRILMNEKLFRKP